MPEQPGYDGLKRRCDLCDKPFRAGDMLACLPMRFAGGSKSYDLIFCFKGGDLEDLKCMRDWIDKYEIRVKSIVDDFIVKIYHGKKVIGDSEHDLVPA